jgi:hypothetical protein
MNALIDLEQAKLFHVAELLNTEGETPARAKGLFIVIERPAPPERG